MYKWELGRDHYDKYARQSYVVVKTVMIRIS
jgi:hypothetical protein